MNIATATIYATHGYKIRRPHWKNSLYLDPKDEHPQSFLYAPQAYFGFEAEDLMADDWELEP